MGEEKGKGGGGGGGGVQLFVSTTYEKSAWSSSGKYTGLKDAKSVNSSQFQDVTNTFSDLMSPWHTPSP